MRDHYQQLRARGKFDKVTLVVCTHKLLAIVNAHGTMSCALRQVRK